MTRLVATAIAALFALSTAPATIAQMTAPPPLDLFFAATSADNRVAKAALDSLAGQWRDSYTPMIIDMARLLRPAPRPSAPSGGADIAAQPTDGPDDGDDPGARSLGAELAAAGGTGVTRESLIRSRLIGFLEKQTGKRFDLSLNGWRAWMWSLPYEPHPEYARFKGMVYGGGVDQRMQRFFPPGAKSLVRLDEIDWGGVTVNGIPPLYYPKVVSVEEARYLRDGNLVFGVVVNGEPRAYPKRILAWHEMAVDKLGGTELTVVYCTLCGTVIPYDSVVGGKRRGFGTSGLLYRSNKLMFDEETMSLWSTLEGKPVVGSLVDSGLQLTVTKELVDTSGRTWRQGEEELTLADGSIKLPRFVAQRAFWFGWYAQYPATLLLGR